MKPDLSNTKIKDDIMLTSHSISGAYSIMKHEVYEKNSIPLNTNTLNFTIIDLTESFYSKLYTESGRGPSQEFKTRLKSYFIYTLLSLLILLTFSIVLYRETEAPASYLYVSVISILILFILSSLLLFLLIKFKLKVLNIRYGIFSLILAKMIYYILLDIRVFCQITSNSIPTSRLPISYMILIELILSENILFSSFIYMLAIGLSAFCTFVLLNILIFSGPELSFLSEMALIALMMFLKVSECYQRDSRMKHIFWRGAKEDRALAVHPNNIKKCESTDQTMRNEVGPKELCEEVLENMKYISKVIIYKDISTLAKNTVKMLREVKKDLARACIFPEFHLDKDIDEEDYAFISENFMKIYSSDQILLDKSHQDHLQSNSTFPFQNYGVSELKSVLSHLGKSWNFDIFFIYTSTGKSITIISNHLFHKWGILEYFGIPEQTSLNYFQNIEDVKII